jgi:plasmid stabilization system protein ParE
LSNETLEAWNDYLERHAPPMVQLRRQSDAGARPDLGVDFIAEIERCVDAASERLTTYPAINKDVRRVVAYRFPFSVYFRTEERRIVVLAVFHGSRDPAVWQHRI